MLAHSSTNRSRAWHTDASGYYKGGRRSRAGRARQTSPPQRDRQEQVDTGSLRECQLWAGPTWEAALVTCVTVYSSRYPPGKVPGDGNAGWHRARSERWKTGAQAPARPPHPACPGWGPSSTPVHARHRASEPGPACGAPSQSLSLSVPARNVTHPLSLTGPSALLSQVGLPLLPRQGGPGGLGSDSQTPERPWAVGPSSCCCPHLGFPGLGTRVPALQPTRGKACGHSLPPHPGLLPRGPCRWGL